MNADAINLRTALIRSNVSLAMVGPAGTGKVYSVKQEIPDIWVIQISMPVMDNEQHVIRELNIANGRPVLFDIQVPHLDEEIERLIVRALDGYDFKVGRVLISTSWKLPKAIQSRVYLFNEEPGWA